MIAHITWTNWLLELCHSASTMAGSCYSTSSSGTPVLCCVDRARGDKTKRQRQASASSTHMRGQALDASVTPGRSCAVVLDRWLVAVGRAWARHGGPDRSRKAGQVLECLLEPSWPIVAVQSRARSSLPSGRGSGGSLHCTGGLSAAARARRTGGGVPRARMEPHVASRLRHFRLTLARLCCPRATAGLVGRRARLGRLHLVQF